MWSCCIVGVSLFNITQLFSKAKKSYSRRALTRDRIVLWRLFYRESAQILYSQKQQFLLKISAATMCVYLCQFSRNCFRKSYGQKPDKQREINQSISQSINQSINQSTNQPTNQPTNQSINQSIYMTTWRPQTTARSVLCNWGAQFGEVCWCQTIQTAMNYDRNTELNAFTDV